MLFPIIMPRTIMHVDGDAFYVSVERVFDPRLRGKPVIVGGAPQGRQAVLSVSPEAWSHGVRPMMPAFQARRLCPDALWLAGDAGRYVTASQMMKRILEQYSPCVESESMGQFYVDMTGCERLHGHPLGAAFRVRRQMLDATELHVSIGIAATRLAARLASSVAKPQGILFVLPGQEASFLAPMPISVLSGVTPKTERQLLLLGIRRLGDLGRLNPETLRPVIGEQGIRWRSQALALDQAAVEGQTEKRICWETTFDSEVIDFEVLQQSLGELIAKACKKCREAGLKAHRVAVHLLYTDLQRVVRSRTLKPGTDLDLVVLNAAQAVLKHLYTRRAAVRLLGVTLSDFLREQAPCLPFDGGDALMRRRFYAGVDAVRDRFGFDSLKTGGVFALRRRLAPDNRMERSHDAQ